MAGCAPGCCPECDERCARGGGKEHVGVEVGGIAHACEDAVCGRTAAAEGEVTDCGCGAAGEPELVEGMYYRRHGSNEVFMEEDQQLGEEQ